MTAPGCGSCGSTPASTRPPQSSSSTTSPQRLPFKLEVIQTDNGTEFGSAFHWHALDKGIGHVYIKPRTPRLNGTVERSHRIDAEEFYRLFDGVVIDDAVSRMMRKRPRRRHVMMAVMREVHRQAGAFTKWFAILLLGLPALAVVAFLVLRGGQDATQAQEPRSTATQRQAPPAAVLGRTTLPPWPLPRDVSARVEVAGLDLGPMGMAEHYHPRLAVTVDGQPMALPTGIGIDPATGAMSALHTHSSDGVLHVEAAKRGEKFTLGQLFIQWDVALTQTQVGGAAGTVRVSVNGKPYSGDPAALVLAPGQEIEVEVRSS
jgi:hypothetical protein